jgi:DNA recombination protein RmuC
VSSIIAMVLLIITIIVQKKSSQLEEQLRSFQLKLVDLEDQNNDLKMEYALLHAKHLQDEKSAQEKLQLLKEAKDQLSQEFSLLSNKIFEEKAKHFSVSNKEQMELLLQPFREQITKFSKQTQEQYETQLKERYLLKDELSRLQQMNLQLSEDAINLTNALKGENKTQGNWGEIVLENILEQSGLREGVEYELQASLKSQEGKTYRPDVIIHLPQQRDVIIDSKVSLVAYERFINGETQEEKDKALKEHIISISAHIKGLSQKRYENLEGVKSLDFVLLFMPIEGAFLLALQKDGEFFKKAYENNILVVSPSTLLVTLRTIEHIWRTQHQEEHAKKIADEGEAMLHKLALFVEEMHKIGALLQNTQKAYDKAMGRLNHGSGNLIKRAQNMQELGVKLKKEIPLKSEEG